MQSTALHGIACRLSTRASSWIKSRCVRLAPVVRRIGSRYLNVECFLSLMFRLKPNFALLCMCTSVAFSQQVASQACIFFRTHPPIPQVCATHSRGGHSLAWQAPRDCAKHSTAWHRLPTQHPSILLDKKQMRPSCSSCEKDRKSVSEPKVGVYTHSIALRLIGKAPRVFEQPLEKRSLFSALQALCAFCAVRLGRVIYGTAEWQPHQTSQMVRVV